MTEVVAGLIILLGLFGWMDVLIIAKFFKVPYIDECIDNVDPKVQIGELKNQKLASIISIMITTVFAMGSPSESDTKSFSAYSNYVGSTY
jgi:hypothetical protein